METKTITITIDKFVLDKFIRDIKNDNTILSPEQIIMDNLGNTISRVSGGVIYDNDIIVKINNK